MLPAPTTEFVMRHIMHMSHDTLQQLCHTFPLSVDSRVIFGPRNPRAYVAPVLTDEVNRYIKIADTLQLHLDNIVLLSNIWMSRRKWVMYRGTNLGKAPQRTGLRAYIEEEFARACQLWQTESPDPDKIGKTIYVFVRGDAPHARPFQEKLHWPTLTIHDFLPKLRGYRSLVQIVWYGSWRGPVPPTRTPSAGPIGSVAPVSDPISPLMMDFIRFGHKLSDSIEFAVLSDQVPRVFSNRERRKIKHIIAKLANIRLDIWKDKYSTR